MKCHCWTADYSILNKETAPPPLSINPIPFPSSLMQFCHSITRVTVSHCLTIAFLGMVVLTGFAGWVVPYNIHTSLGRQNDRQWELRCQLVLSRQLTSTPFLFSTVILYLLTGAALIVAAPPPRASPPHWYTWNAPDINFFIVDDTGKKSVPN